MELPQAVTVQEIYPTITDPGTPAVTPMKSNAPSSSKRRTVLIIVGAAALIFLAAAAVYYPRARQQWQTPLGPGLGMVTHTPVLTLASQAPVETRPAAAVARQATPVQAAANQSTVPATATNVPTATPQPLCGGPALMTVLAVGTDNRDFNYMYGLADVIRIVRVDFVTPRVTVLSLPRDLWVEIPGISDHYGITNGKLNQAYFYGSPEMAYYDGPGAGPGLLARTIDQNFGLAADHYGAVNMLTFAKIVDAVGGLDLVLPNDVDGTPVDAQTEDMGYFYAGKNHFNGSQALRFARIRKRYNDFTRMDNQNMVICALKAKLTTPAVLPKIPKIIAAFQGSVLTDLSLEQMSQMACLLPSLKRENIVFGSLPDELFTQARKPITSNKVDTTFVLEADNAAVREYIARFMAGTWPDKPKEPTCP